MTTREIAIKANNIAVHLKMRYYWNGHIWHHWWKYIKIISNGNCWRLRVFRTIGSCGLYGPSQLTDNKKGNAEYYLFCQRLNYKNDGLAIWLFSLIQFRSWLLHWVVNNYLTNLTTYVWGKTVKAKWLTSVTIKF